MDQERHLKLLQIWFVSQHTMTTYHERAVQARENWIRGSRSPGSFKYNAKMSADAGKNAREALFELIDMRSAELQKPWYDCEDGHGKWHSDDPCGSWYPSNW